MEYSNLTQEQKDFVLAKLQTTPQAVVSVRTVVDSTETQPMNESDIMSDGINFYVPFKVDKSDINGNIKEEVREYQIVASVAEVSKVGVVEEVVDEQTTNTTANVVENVVEEGTGTQEEASA